MGSIGILFQLPISQQSYSFQKISCMSIQQQTQVNQYQLTIMHVKMKVKFPCKMKLQHCGNALTDEVLTNQQNKFVFNQDVIIKEQASKQFLQLNINLITEKGSKYVSGLLKIEINDLVRSEGDKIILPLIKCLDSEAFCELKVSRIKQGKLSKRVSVSSTLIQNNKDAVGNTVPQNLHDKLLLPPKAKRTLAVQTRSQFGFGNNLNGKNHEWDETRSKGPAQTLIYKSSFMKSPHNKKLTIGQTKLFAELNNQHETVSQKERFAESQVYKQGYDKLKQKYKKQAELAKSQMNKRLSLQANQNNYKIQLMRLRLRTDEQQKIISQKNDRIKSLQVSITEIQKQQLDMNFLKEQNNNLIHKVEILNDTINTIKKDNQQLKSLNYQRSQMDQNLIKELRIQVQSIKNKLQNQTTQSKENLRQKTQQILSLSSELKAKVQQIENQKIQIQKLESHIHSKLYQFQKTLQAQKNNSNSKSNELKSKIDQIQRQKKMVQNDLDQIKNQKQKMKGLVLKVQYDKKVLVQQQKSLRNQLFQLKSIKQKNSQLNREIIFLQDDKKNLQKNIQSTVQSKEINLQQITEQYQTKINYYKKQLKQLEEKYKALSCKIIQVQSQLQVGKSSQEKQKRIIDSQCSEISDLKNKQKQQKTYSTSLQHQNLSLQNQISSYINKSKYSDQTNRIEIEKFRQTLEKTKNQLSSQNLKCLQLFESKSNLQMQLGKTKIQLQYAQQKIDKFSTNNKQLLSKVDYMTKQHQAQVNDYEQILQKYKKKQKQHNQKIHASELQKINTAQTIEILKKQQKINQQKINYLQSNLKGKQQEYSALDYNLKSVQKKFLQQEMQFTSEKHNHNILRNQKNKLQKILEIKEIDIEDKKKEIKNIQAQKGKLQLIELELRNRLKKQNQLLVKTQMRLKTVQKEFQKFREVLFSTIKTEYTKIPVLQKKQSAMSSPSKSTDRQILQEQTPLTNIILSTLMNNIGDSRQTVNKLIQHNKQLKKQIQRLYQESQQTNNKFQFSQLQLHRDIQQLQQQIQIVYTQKQQQIINYDNIVSDLNCRLYQKDNLISELGLQCEQLQYALSSLKLDFQTNNDQNDKKVFALKSTVHQLEQKIEFTNLSLANQQDRNQQLQDKLQILKTQKSQLSESNIKKSLTIQQLEQIRVKYEHQLHQSKRERKQLRQSISQFQIALSSTKDLLQKNKQILINQQKKNQQLKEFTNILMKEKQCIIRIQLEKSEKLLILQTELIQLKMDQQLLAQDHLRLKLETDQLKQLSKKQSNTIKSLQQQLAQQKSKSAKLTQKIKEKQKQLLMKQQIISRLDIKYRELAQNNYKSTLSLHDQLDTKYQQNINITTELNQRITLLQAQVQELQHLKTKQHHKYVLQSDQLLAEREYTQLLKRQVKRLQQELGDSGEEYKSLEFKSQELTKEIKEREQEACQLNNQIVILQGQYQALVKDKTRRLQQLNNQWQIKHRDLLEQQEQKVQILEKERDYLRERFAQKQNELGIAIHETKSVEASLSDIKKNYQQKVKKLQSERLTTILQKNNQLKKLQTQNKSLIQNAKTLQNSIRELTQTLQVTKQKFLVQQRKYNQLQDKQKTLKRIQQSQIQTLTRKQAQYKSYKQTLSQCLYSNQRQVRKVLQNYIKKIMDVCDANKIDEIAKACKGLQNSIIAAMMAKLELTK